MAKAKGKTARRKAAHKQLSKWRKRAARAAKKIAAWTTRKKHARKHQGFWHGAWSKLRPAKAKKPTRAQQVEKLIQAAELALQHAPDVHYTEGAERWDGIAHKRLASKGQYPHYADCSAFVTWLFWQLFRNGPDIMNGDNWAGGFTGTLLQHGKRRKSKVPGKADLIFYGVPGTTGKHVAFGIGAGWVISHGSEGGPYKLRYDYRSDIMECRSYL